MSGRRNGRLVFDSESAARKVGRRSAEDFGRVLLFRSDRYAVDVVVHAPADDLRLYHGQVVDERSGAPLAAADVSLDSETVRTDEFGQFSLSELTGDELCVLRVQTPDTELMCSIPGRQAHG